MTNMDTYELKEKLEKTSYLVEATEFEWQCLWEKYSEEAQGSREGKRFPWKNHRGIGVQIGELAGRPVMISLNWVTFGNILICFYSCVSEVCDLQMVKRHLTETFPKALFTDASNFMKVLYHADSVKDPLVLTEGQKLIGREHLEDFQKTGVLSTLAFEMAPLAMQRGEEGVSGMNQAVQEVNNACARFRDHVWLPWLKEYYQQSDVRGHHAQSGNLSMMVYGLAGRVMVTLRYRDIDAEYVSLLGYEEVPGMYIRGARGTAQSLCALINEAARLSSSLEDDIRPDTEVQLAL